MARENLQVGRVVYPLPLMNLTVRKGGLSPLRLNGIQAAGASLPYQPANFPPTCQFSRPANFPNLRIFSTVL